MLSMLISDSRFDLVWFRLSCDHGWIRSGSVNVRKQQQQQQQLHTHLMKLITEVAIYNSKLFDPKADRTVAGFTSSRRPSSWTSVRFPLFMLRCGLEKRALIDKTESVGCG